MTLEKSQHEGIQIATIVNSRASPVLLPDATACISGNKGPEIERRSISSSARPQTLHQMRLRKGALRLPGNPSGLWEPSLGAEVLPPPASHQMKSRQLPAFQPLRFTCSACFP